jgi:hypothetical protein
VAYQSATSDGYQNAFMGFMMLLQQSAGLHFFIN